MPGNNGFPASTGMDLDQASLKQAMAGLVPPGDGVDRDAVDKAAGDAAAAADKSAADLAESNRLANERRAQDNPDRPADSGRPAPSDQPDGQDAKMDPNRPPNMQTHGQHNPNDPRKDLFYAQSDFLTALVLWSEILGPAIGTVEMAAVGAVDLAIRKATGEKENLSTLWDKAVTDKFQGVKETLQNKMGKTPAQAKDITERAQAGVGDAISSNVQSSSGLKANPKPPTR